MALIKQHKFVAALPATLEADSIYFVRTGVGFDQYVTNSSGQIVAYPANDKWDALKTPAIAAGALALDLSSPAGFRVALNQSVTALTLAGVPSGRVVVFTITWVQDATGGRTVAFPASVKADGGGAPVQPAAGVNAVTVQSFYTDDGGVTVWQASGAPADLYRRSNILGTVSQSGGVPTGAIIERGSNANGQYVRYADGTQECITRAFSATLAVGEAVGFDCTFPASFAEPPVVAPFFFVGSGSDANPTFIITSVRSSPTVSGCRVVARNSSQTVALGPTMYAIAKGRWY